MFVLNVVREKREVVEKPGTKLLGDKRLFCMNLMLSIGHVTRWQATV